jgi:hypothetical protein
MTSPAARASVAGNNHHLGAPPKTMGSFTHVLEAEPLPELDPTKPAEPHARTLGKTSAMNMALEDKEDADLLAQDLVFSHHGSSVGGGSEFGPPNLGELGFFDEPA